MTETKVDPIKAVAEMPCPCDCHEDSDVCDHCQDTNLRWPQLSRECPGYEYYGHKPLSIIGDYATCEYVGEDWKSDPDIYAPGNQKVAALVQEALQRDNPLDEWLDAELHKAHLGDTAIRESAYLTVMTNIPHPPCNGSGRIPDVTLEKVLLLIVGALADTPLEAACAALLAIGEREAQDAI
jgi:hypothetical protein